MKLRRVSFDAFDEVVDDIRRLHADGYTHGGNWNLSQICDHLAATLRGGMHGGIKPMPWIARATAGKLLTEYILLSRRMGSGFPTPVELAPAQLPADDPARVDECIATLAEARDFSGPLRPHPYCLGLTLPKWKRLMLIHCGHHLSFLQPAEKPQAADAAGRVGEEA